MNFSSLGIFAALSLFLVLPSLATDITTHLSPKLKELHPEMYDCEAAKTRTKVYRVQNRLDMFMRRLRSFIHETVFDVAGFDLRLEKLNRTHARLENLAKSNDPCISRLNPQFNFARKMFQVMIDSAEIMKFYKLENGLAQSLIHKTAQLNVRVLALYNHNGSPDPRINDFSTTVFLLEYLVHSWAKIFENVENVEPSLLLAFCTEFFKADETLENLGRYFSELEA
ncbi:hypothetical protein JCM33374_g2481 [Metschnikowia sp. JCM 33374]|nr:hypothetical protein JCM33374_g2481 [Metschnikowia sp. JCM 33374]